MALPFINDGGASHGKRKRKRDDEVLPDAAGIDIGASSHWLAVPRRLAEQAGCEPAREVGAMTDDLNAPTDRPTVRDAIS